MLKKKIVCTRCGSDEVVKDAYAQWNVDKQNWEIQNLFDMCFCEVCERECSIKEEYLDADPAQVRVPDEAGNNPT